MFCQSHVVGCFVKPMSSQCRGMSSPCRGMSSPCCSMPFAHIVACLAISWHVLSIPCRGMPCQALVEACRARVKACRARAEACLVPLSWHVKPCGCMPCQAKVVGCLFFEKLSFSQQSANWNFFITFFSTFTRHVEPMSWQVLPSASQLLPIASQVLPSAQVPKAQEP
jgi:hypothetical protein